MFLQYLLFFCYVWYGCIILAHRVGCESAPRKGQAMERIVSHRQLKHGVMILVKDRDNNVVFSGQVVGFPYSSGPHGRSANGTPDMVLIRLKSNKDEAKRFAELGLDPRFNIGRRTYLID